MITAEFLFAIAPGASNEIVNSIIASEKYLALNGIIDPTEICYQFGQIAVETAGFTRIEENLNYTSTKRLRQVWPSRFKSDAAAAPYVRNPKKLANLVYGGRLGNRKGTDDGWDYRGSGCKQTTGRANFADVERETGVKCVADPDLLRRFPSAFEAACVYWRIHNLRRFIASGNITGLTKAIQGGSGGLKDRKIFTDRALKNISKLRRAATGKPSLPGKPVQSAERTEWLRRGSKEYDIIKEAQRDLQRHGYYIGGKIDGSFGDGTDLAVREFQRDNGLIADGVIGDKTWSALKTDPKRTATPSPAPVQPSQADKPSNLLATILAAVVSFLMTLIGKGGKNG